MKIRTPTGWLRIVLLAFLLVALGWGLRGSVPLRPVKGGGGELRVILPYEPKSLDPGSIRDEAALILAQNLYSRLLALDADSRLLPDLAESWTVGPAGLVYTFHLRRGVRWHDGRPFGAEDVLWTLQRLRAEPGFLAEAARRIGRVEAPDPATVVVRMKEPWAPFLADLAGPGGHILPRHLADRKAGRPIGTGPFELWEWVRGRRIVLTPNRSFYRPGPWLDRVVYTFSSDSRSVPELLLSGQADFSVLRPPLSRIPHLEQDRRVRVAHSIGDSRIYCGFNLRRRSLADHRVREAINRAIDRHEILRRALHGYGAPAFGFYTPAVTWAYNGEARVPDFDRNRARELLDQAGWRPRADGVRLELDLVTTSVSPYTEIAGILREQLRTVGIEARLVLLPLDQVLERVLTRHDFDLAVIAGNQGPDPENLNVRFGSQGASQFMGYSSPELDAALAEGARTIDLSRRARAYFRAQQILARDLPIAPLAEGVQIVVYRAGVRGLPQVEARGLVPVHDYSLVRVVPGGVEGLAGGGEAR